MPELRERVPYKWSKVHIVGMRNNVIVTSHFFRIQKDFELKKLNLLQITTCNWRKATCHATCWRPSSPETGPSILGRIIKISLI